MIEDKESADAIEAQAMLANPAFNVEEFIRNINIHYKNQRIVETLGGDADLVLSIVESGEYKFLELQPRFIDPKIFDTIAARGHETWSKTSNGRNRYSVSTNNANVWYGVIINENLAFHYRRISASRYKAEHNFEVHKSDDTSGALAKEMRRRWKELKMVPMGTTKEQVVPPVYEIRTKLRKFINEISRTVSGRSPEQGWRRRDIKPSNAEIFIRAAKETQSGSYHRDYHNLKFQLLQSGKEEVRVKIEDFIGWDANNRRPHNLLVPCKENDAGTHVSASEKFKMDDPNLSLKILDWASKATKENLDYRNNLLLKLDSLLKDAGLV